MKFEEVLILIRNDRKKIEDFEHKVISSGIWVQFSEETCTSWTNLIKKEFRLKPQKIIEPVKFVLKDIYTNRMDGLWSRLEECIKIGIEKNSKLGDYNAKWKITFEEDNE